MIHDDDAANTALPEQLRGQIQFNSEGLIPAIAQDAHSGEVLMMAWMNAAALAATLRTQQGTYWSRSRGELWVKGATSGHTQQVVSVSLDCDADTVLLRVQQSGPACHTGTRTCFTGREILATDDATGDSATSGLSTGGES